MGKGNIKFIAISIELLKVALIPLSIGEVCGKEIASSFLNYFIFWVFFNTDELCLFLKAFGRIFYFFREIRVCRRVIEKKKRKRLISCLNS